MQNQDFRRFNPRKTGQSGNALWYILIAIALLAALTLTLTRNASKNADNLPREQARVLAERAYRTLNTYQEAVSRLMMAGCGENAISFENASQPAYANANAPSDKRCHLFDMAGAGLAPLPDDDGSTDKSLGLSQMWEFTGSMSVPGIGPEEMTQGTCASNCSELIAYKQAIKYEVCLEYNLLAGVNAANGGEPYEDTTGVTGTAFTGTFTAGTSGVQKIEIGGGTAGTALYGVPTACFYGTNSGVKIYRIYRVLASR